MKFKFERIDDYHSRAKVHGGWLVKVCENVVHVLDDRGMDCGWDYRIAMAFVPDPKHEWEVLDDQ